jgi:hypothetical protein
MSEKIFLRWQRINRKRLPKTGTIIAGGFRKGEWTMSSPSDGNGFPYFADNDRTHYIRIPVPEIPIPKL